MEKNIWTKQSEAFWIRIIPSVQYIIIDGGSTDNSINIIKKYEKDLYFWISEKDNGISDAFNKGIARATGDIIGIINADDWYESQNFRTGCPANG